MLAFLDSLCAALIARDAIRIRHLLAHPLARALPGAVRDEANAIAGGSSRGFVAPLQAMRWLLLVQDHDVEIPQRHSRSPGYAVTNLGVVSPARINQTLTTAADWPFGPVRIARIVNF